MRYTTLVHLCPKCEEAVGHTPLTMFTDTDDPTYENRAEDVCDHLFVAKKEGVDDGGK